MFVQTDITRWGMHCPFVWFPESPEALRAIFEKAEAVEVFSSAFDARAAGLLRYRARWEDWWTSIVDLSQSEEQLWQKTEPKSCRYELRKAEKIGFTVHVNERLDEAFALVREFITRKGYRAQMGDEEWQQYQRIANIHSIVHDGATVAVHVMLLDPKLRARLLVSATASRDDERLGKIVGPLNRRLHWEELRFYKAEGYAEYDFGGIWPEPGHPFLSIGQFKESFGGERRKLNNFLLIKNPLKRATWMAARKAKHLLKRLRGR